jgi:putative ABC transport system permease protein
VLGGLAGIALGMLLVLSIQQGGSIVSVFGTYLSPDLFVRALVTVIVMGLVGGAYPAWWAGRLLPLEALGYEGGGRVRGVRLLPGGMAVRSLLRRRTRTALTLLAIGVGIATVVVLGALAEGMTHVMTQLWRASQTDLFAIEAGVDSDFSAIDERVGARIAARPDVEAVSGVIMTAVSSEQTSLLLVYGYHPREFAVRHFRIVEGEQLSARHQVIVGRRAARQMGLAVGDTLRLLDSSFRVVGIYETGLAFEEIGVVIGLREVQALIGKPRQVMYFGIKLHDPAQAGVVLQDLEVTFPEIDFALTSEIIEAMSDFAVMEDMIGQISFLAVFIGGVGMLITMLMSVLERTREIGVLRSLGWRRRQVLGMILRESLVLGGVGGVCGVLLGFCLHGLLRLVPGVFGSIDLVYTPRLFAQVAVVALVSGVAGGLYPAWRASRMRPVEALRYE